MVPEREGQGTEDRKKAKKVDEKAKIHVGSQTVIGRQTAALGHYSTFLTRELRVEDVKSDRSKTQGAVSRRPRDRRSPGRAVTKRQSTTLACRETRDRTGQNAWQP